MTLSDKNVLELVQNRLKELNEFMNSDSFQILIRKQQTLVKDERKLLLEYEYLLREKSQWFAD